MHANGVLTVKMFSAHYGQHCEPFYNQNALDRRILHPQSQIFWGVIPPNRHKSASPGASTQTPISAWFATVFIVSDLHNDR